MPRSFRNYLRGTRRSSKCNSKVAEKGGRRSQHVASGERRKVRHRCVRKKPHSIAIGSPQAVLHPHSTYISALSVFRLKVPLLVAKCLHGILHPASLLSGERRQGTKERVSSLRGGARENRGAPGARQQGGGAPQIHASEY